MYAVPCRVQSAALLRELSGVDKSVAATQQEIAATEREGDQLGRLGEEGRTGAEGEGTGNVVLPCCSRCREQFGCR